MSERSSRGSWSGMRATLVDGIRSRLWPVPTAGVVVALALAALVVRLDGWVDTRVPQYAQVLLFGGDADAARSVLSAVAGSMITVTSLTFSLTVVTLQLASSQFSPRLLRTFAADGVVQSTLALFLATFVFALSVLRSVRGSNGTDGEFIPRLSVNLTVLLAVASVLALVVFLAHLAREIRVERMLTSVHDVTDATIRRELIPLAESEPAPPLTPPTDAVPVISRRSGFLIAVDEQKLMAAALDTDTVIWVDQPPGASIIAGTPTAWFWPLRTDATLPDGDREERAERVRAGLALDFERSGATDVSFGLRQITDVAVKALSPGINDPTTATHALGHSAALLGTLACRETATRVVYDDAGRIRLALARPSFADLLDLALDQPRRYGAGEPAIQIRILQLIREVAYRTTTGDRMAALRLQLELTVSSIEQQDFDSHVQAQLAERVTESWSAVRGEWRPCPLID